jgi:hypothetical protein
VAAVGLGAAVLAGLALLAPVTSGVARAHDGGDATSVPVAFDVVTHNNSGLPCDPLTLGAKHLTVRGHITGPSDELDADQVDGTLYSHGDGYNETFWRYPGDGDYNYADQMSRRGHVSVTIDRLGYGASSRPNGNSVCYGNEADVLHQVITHLRHGSYQGDHTPRFERVGLVGHSASGLIVEQEAAGFHDVDALGVLDSGELDAQPLVVVRVGQEQARCLTSPDGYAPLEANGAEFRSDHIDNVEPEIADYLTDHRTEDACAGLRNSAQAIAGNGVRNSTIHVPVLLLAGANDKFFNHIELQAPTYSGSPKVTVQTVPETGHAVAFSRNAPIFQDDMDRWLSANHL